MAAKRHNCYTVTRDVCGTEHENNHTGVTLHYDDPEHAAEDARDHDWAATENAEQAICPTEDAAHRAKHAEVSATATRPSW